MLGVLGTVACLFFFSTKRCLERIDAGVVFDVLFCSVLFCFMIEGRLLRGHGTYGAVLTQ